MTAPPQYSFACDWACPVCGGAGGRGSHLVRGPENPLDHEQWALHQLGGIVMANMDTLDLAPFKDEIEKLSLYGVSRVFPDDLATIGQLAVEHAVSFESLALHDRVEADRLLLTISQDRASRALDADRHTTIEGVECRNRRTEGGTK